MNKVGSSRRVLIFAGLGFVLAAIPIASAFDAVQEPTPGRDIIMCQLQDTGPFKWGSSGDILAYSIAVQAVNTGTADLAWVAFNDQHPVILQNFYRLKAGRFEQIGMGWCPHGFCALQQTSSCTSECNGAGGCPAYLVAGCGSPTTGSSAGGTGNTIGPRWQVNAWTGEFVYPPAAADAAVPSMIRRRIQVHAADLDPALNSGAIYLAEAGHVHPGDAQDGNHYNNASYREFVVGPLVNGAYTLTWAVGSTTQVMEPAVNAWETMDAGVQHSVIDIPGEGRLLLYYKASDNGDGTWHYEYAMYNVNSDRSAGSFSIPVPPGVTVSNVGFHDVDYHSGDGIGGVNFDDTDWPGVREAASLRWATESFADNPNANALRFATTYNFRFDANTPPMGGEAVVALFKPGEPGSIVALAVGPSTHPCPADVDGDGAVGAADLALLLGAWGPGDGNPPDLDADGLVNAADLGTLLGAWGLCL